MSDLSDRIAGLSAEKRALLARRLQQKEREAEAEPPSSTIAPRPNLRTWPLSYAQERFWFLQRYAPESAFYNDFTPLRLEGPLDPGALGGAVDAILRRHDVLRGRFAEMDGRPVQEISPWTPPYLAAVDLSALPPPRRHAEERRWIAWEAGHPFDLTRGPLLRAILLRLGPEEHSLLLSMHHMATDGWSWVLLMRELGAFYGGSPPAEMPVQYADYAAWQRQQLSREALEGQLAYWREALRGLPPALDLPLDRPRPAVPALRGGSVPFVFPRLRIAGLEELGRRRSMTPFMVLLAAFQGLLGRYSGQDDGAVGTPTAGRNHAATHGLIGVFINMLVLRARSEDDPPFLDFLDRVRQVTADAYAHQDLPFDHLVEALRPQRSGGHQPLFQVLFSVQEEGTGGPLELPGLTTSVIDVVSPAAKYDLNLSLSVGAELHGLLRYDADLFDRVTMQRFSRCFEHWLAALAEAPERRLSEVPLLGEVERHQLLCEWSAGNGVAGDGPLAHELFGEQARRQPDAVAVEDGVQSLSFAELDRRSDRLAARLRGLGVGPEVRVALCVEPSAEALAGLLAVWKAGGVWVSLDPSYPQERLAALLEDCGAPLLLTRERWRDALPPLRCLDLDREETYAGKAPATTDPAPLASCNAAYVIYTSGSTGRPKGVVVSHGSLSNYLRWSFSGLRGLVDRPVPLVSSMSFDGSLKQFLTPLMYGRAVWVPRAGAADPEALLGELAGRGGVGLSCVPSLWRALLALLEAGRPAPRLECLVLGGEPVDTALVDRTLAVLPGVEILNVYGPTEATVNASLCRVAPGISPTLGRPAAGARLHVLDRRLRTQPIGVPGELAIGGPGLARGYLGRPELTAERFVPDPFGEPGGRLYRSGDLVRFRTDGEIEFLGRIDAQVKVRGYRIEPGEVEAALAACPGVREAAVLARQDRPGDVVLAAYVVALPGASLAGRELRESLLERLPEFMVPAAFILLDELPLLPNGKVDRRALPAPEAPPAAAGTAPRTPVEELLAGIWSEVLRRDRVGVEDNFFELGGHSLLATQVVSRARSVLGTSLPLRALFEAPTVAGLARQIELLERGAAAQPIPPVDRGRPLPPSFAQERLWFLDQLEPGSARYNIPAVLRLAGRLDIPAFAAALSEIARRHEVLRTTFAVAGGTPVQVVHPAHPVAPPVVVLTSLPEAAREAEALRLAQQEVLRPFDLAAGPLVRVGLLRLDADHHVVLATMHHIVSDGWSAGVFLRELGTLYGAFAAGRPSPLPELPIQYADFAAWQRGWLTGEVLEAQLAWWRQRLAGAPPLLELPADRPRPAVLSARGGSVELHLPGQALAALSRRQGTTLFMTLLGLFQVLLGRHAGSEDVVIGSPIAGRTRSEIEPLIGFFVNTLALRSDLSGSPTVRELLARVRETALGAYAHQDVPFERLVEELAPARDLGRTPLFQVMLTLQNTPDEVLELPGLRLEGVPLATRPVKFDLTLTLAETGDGLEGMLSYSTDLFDAATAARLAERFRGLAEAAAAEPERPVSDLPLATPAERHQLLYEWSAGEEAPGAGPLAHELFREQARRQPDAVAVEDGVQSLSFAELDRRSGRLAARLRGAGVGPEVRVALCARPSAEALAGLLAVWKAGGVWVSIDPSYPRERLAGLLEDCGAPLLLTQEEWRDALPPLPIRRLYLDHEETYAAKALPATELHPDNAAYVIYTSGSTGRPKGVVVSHGSLSSYLRWSFSGLRGLVERPVPLVSSMSFDGSLKQFLTPLMHGESVWVPRAGAADPEALLGEMAGRGGVALSCVPSLWKALLALLESGRPVPRLECLVLGGEPVDTALADRTLALLPGVEILNVYGPTEATVNASLCRVGPGVSPTLGRPVAGARLHVFDRRWQVQPAGVPGELVIGGSGLARGYLGRPELTAERFVPDPFGEPGGRLYRSGDLVRFRRDGEIEFLGRTDAQVKVRGYRIEPGEIEAALAACPGVREAAVLARQDRPGDVVLAAYVTALPGAGLAARELRESLLARLPEFMVPAAFVLLEAFPLLPNGKVDRRALPAPEAVPAAACAAPRTPVEELLAGIWAEVLRRDRIGVEDNFFELGGHSLLATQVVSRARALLGVSLPLRALFESPTVAGLARQIERLERGAAAQPIPPVDRGRRGAPLPLSFAQERLWFLDQLEPGSSRYNIPTALRLLGRFDLPAFATALSEIARRHEILRTTFAVAGGAPVQVVGPARPVVPPVVDLGGLPEDEALRLAQEEALRPFDLAAGPLLRVTLLRLGAEDHVVLANMHHIVSDGWSAGVLVRELVALYGAFLEGRPSPLAELPVQYADFAAWQRDWLTGEVLDTQLAWWRHRLAGAPPLLELPTDRPRPAVLSSRGGSVEVRLPGRALAALSRRQGTTLFMTLLGLFQALLGRHAGGEDVVVGSPIAGRTRSEVEPLIGFFVNTLALRSDLSGSPSVRELLARVRETALGAYAHQDVPFEKLVEELAPERDLGRTPLFQVMLVLQNTPDEALELPGLRLEGLPLPVRAAKFDLTLTLAGEADRLEGLLGYSADLFDAATMARMIERFRVLSEAAAADPERPVAELPLLPAAELQQALVEWNDTALPFAPGICLHDLVSRQAASTPDAVAVSFEGRELSYGELERRANRLAHHLIYLGVGPEERVGLLLERSLEMVVGVLGVFKAGAAYVPLDPNYPAERLATLVESAGARVVLTPESWEEIGAGSDTPPEIRSPDRSLAYVLFTSGSTGTPKGVMVPHRGVVNRLLWAQEVYRLGPEDVVLQKAPFSFDFSVWEMFAPLLAGARLVLAEPGGQRDAAYLARAVVEHGVTIVHFVPSMLGVFLEEPGLERCTSLRQVFSGGEALSPALRDRFLERLGRIPLDNQYGPTEISIDTTRWVCRPGPVSLGRPIANSRLYVADRELRPRPPGAAGELLIGGAGPARGYLGRPDLTAAAFVPDPFGPEPGGRLYRTGDLMRQLPDGGLEFLGRIDHQVKVRGFRIELGEIEAALGSHPAVRECVVVARDGVLVAYAAGDLPEAGELRAFLAGRLPEYMVPAVFVPLKTLPLTPSGKVDRRALPAPEAPPAATGTAPRTPVEELLAGIWSEVLGRDRIGVEDNFFELGGHSLLATRVMSRVRSLFGASLPLRALFEAPTIAALARRIEPRERGAALHIPRADRSRPLPLSFAQERLWFLDQLEPGSARYTVPAVVRLVGPLDLPAFSAALDEVVRRHEALRTRFGPAGETPVQIVEPARPVALPVVDLEGLPEAEALRLAQKEALRPFDLAAGPLLRVTLLRLGAEDHVVLTNMHHIVSDGWSAGVLIRELGTLYGAFAAGRPSPLPELPVQYADFAAWQRGWLTGEVLEAQLAYWRRKLAGAPPLLELPTDRPRPAVLSSRGGSVEVQLPGQALADLSRRQGTTLFMTLLGLFQALLGRHAGSEDVVVGSPIAGRTLSEIEPLIGFFVNTLALRSDLSGSPTVRELLDRVRETALGAYAHQDVPFEKLVEELAPERDLGRTPLFQVMFILQNAPAETLELPGLRLEGLPRLALPVKFDLTLTLSETGDRLTGAITYSADLFDAATMTRLAERLQVLLVAAAADPEGRIADLPLLSEPERHVLLDEWNDTAFEYAGSERCLHELVEEQARRTPERLAVEIEGESLTYRELSRRANQLACHLQRLGVEPEMPVGICAERSLELVVGLLGILKAGGAYVPLDPEYPRERLAYMVEDSGARVVLTQERLAGVLAGSDARQVPLDTAWERIGRERGEPPRVRVAPENLAYVIYTSGSTGRPKGAMNTHRAIANRLLWMQAAYGLDGTDVVLQKTPASFDVSVWEFFWPLMTGATLALARPGGHRDGSYLVERIAEAGVTTLHFVPSMLRVFLETPGLERCRSVRQVMASGEALTPDLEERFFSLFSCELHNLYGPTEAAVDVTFWPCTGDSGERGVPIGRPIANTRIHLLDGSLEPVPVGVTGELYIGGVNLARGYAGRPALTAERFVASPLGFGERLYRTGDLARYRPDGAIEYLGRVDHQVKIRGLRIELGEIEVALGQHPAVAQAVVLVRDERLVAYLVGETVAASELRAFLLKTLPEYMVPAVFVTLPVLPLTPSGKVDRRALSASAASAASAAPERAGLETGEGYVAPSGPTEELLAAVWAEVLGLERVGAQDDFFALGGHSLLATRVVSRIRAVLGVELPLRRLFEARTLVKLAQAVREARRDEASEAPPVVPVPRDGGLPLSYAQERLWLLHQMEPGGTRYNIAAVLRLAGRLDVPVFAAALDEIVRRHETLRTTFALAGESPVQVIAPARKGRWPVVDLSGLDGLPEPEREAEALRLAGEETARPFDLTAGPPLRLHLLRLGAEEHLAVLTLHHIATDGWSMGVLVREMAALYGAFLEGRPSPLPELAIQYADFAVWQRQWLGSGVLERQLAWWRERLAGAPAVLELPTDRPRPAVLSPRGAGVPVRLPAALGRSLAALSRREGATLFMTLLGLFQALLGRHAGSDDLVVGSPIAGRTRAEVEPLIGFFVNTLALRSGLRGGPSVRELLARSREGALGAYAHQDLPFERLVEELSPQRDLSRSPLFQVMFALQNAPATLRDGEDRPGLEIRRVPLASRTAKFDLDLVLSEAGDELLGTAEYSTDLFDATTISRLMERFRVLLEAAVADPERPVAELPVLSAPERQQLLHEWNDTARHRPEPVPVHELVAAHARRRPEAPAVVAGGRVLTYGELDTRANSLAHRLRALGVGPEVRVAVCAERTPERVAGILGILKAGGAYVTLDPSYPRERMAFLLADAEAPVVLTEERFAAQIPETGAAVLRLEADWGMDSAPPAVEVLPQNLAYVVYTSGSTGKPKGVEIPHAGLAHLVRWHVELYGMGERDRGTQVSSPAYDASVWDLWACLAAGAASHIPDEEARLSPAAMVGWWAREGITVTFVPTPVAEGILELPLPPGVEVRELLIGGDRLHRRPGPGLPFRLMNHYGPAEYSVVSTAGEIPPPTPGETGETGDSLPSIGRPIDDTRVLVLDRDLRPAPVGVPGELCVRGAGLARGYLRRPDLTAERFVPDPAAGEPGARMYRTGDLVRWLPDGQLDFLGRIDHQVKLRGQRIELGEIESVLGRHPEVREAAVLLREDRPGDRRLVAYVVPAPDARPADDVLRGFLREELPEHMVPALFVTLETLPLTPNGKVDRQALPAPLAPRGGSMAPRDRTEMELVRIWEELLGAESLGIRDDFFELGGHSLLALRLLGRIESRLGVRLPPLSLFQAPTVESLAVLLRRQSTPEPVPAPVPLVPLQREGEGRPLFWVHPGVGTVYCYVPLVRHLGPGRPVYALQARGVAGPEAPLDRIEDMAALYLRELRRVQPEGPYLLGGWSLGGVVAFEMARQLQAEGGEVELLALVDSVLLPESAVQDSRSLLAAFARDLGLPLDHPLLAPADFGPEDEVETLERLFGPVQQAGLLPPDLGLTEVRRLFTAFRAHAAALARYRPSSPWRGRMALFVAEERPPGAVSPEQSWQGLATAGLDVIAVPGDHYGVVREPEVRTLAARLRGLLPPASD